MYSFVRPKSAIETMMIANSRMEIDGTITIYGEPDRAPRKIAEWLMKYGWKPDTPSQ